MKHLFIFTVFCFLTLAACSQEDRFVFEKSPGSLQEDDLEWFCEEDKSNCKVSNYEVPQGFSYSWGQIFYDGEDTYASLLKAEDIESLTHGEWCIFKNRVQVSCQIMNAGTDGPILEMIRSEDGLRVVYLYTGANETIQTEELLIPSVAK